MKNVPRKQMREIQRALKFITSLRDLSFTLENVVTGETMTFGGQWDSIRASYGEISNKSSRVIKVTKGQWEAMLIAYEALYNPVKLMNGQNPIVLLVVNAPRRSGKTVLLALIHFMMMVAKPGSKSRLVSLRQSHGDQVIKWIMEKILRYDDSLYTYDKNKKRLTLINGSSMSSHAEVNKDADRGSADDLDTFDEAAFLKEDTISAATPAITDKGGFFVMVGSPNGRNHFQQLAEKARDCDPRIREIIKNVQLSPDDNVFVPYLKRMQETMIHVLSESAYRQEMLGLFEDEKGRVLTHFERSTHVQPASMIDDDTPRMCHVLFGKSYKYVVGVDYNTNPTAGVICQFDTEGHIWYVGEVLTPHGTEIWGERLWQRLTLMGCDDPYKDAVIIGDASGAYQDFSQGRKTQGSSYAILKKQGWKIYMPTARRKTNPSVAHRMEVARSMHYNAAGEIRMHVDPSCEALIKSFETLPLNKTGLPDKNNKNNHIYDAATYPLYRVWGTKSGVSVWGKMLIHVPDRGKELLKRIAA